LINDHWSCIVDPWSLVCDVEDKMNYKDKWVLITGASSGMGSDYAELFASQDANIILTARRESNLVELKNKIATKYPNSKVVIVSSDLSNEEGCQNLIREINKQDIQVHTLINNAGYGIYGEFTEMNWSEVKNMLDLDIISLTYLTHHYVKEMKARNEGQILLVASIGAYQPCPLYASYGAAKAYVLNFGEALNVELAGTNVKISVLSPGVTETEFFERSGQKQSLYQKIVMMKSMPVAKVGIRSMEKGALSVIPGFMNNLIIFLNRFSPRKVTAILAHQLMK